MSNTSAIMKSTSSNEFNWNSINWFHINRYVETMQQRIYRAELLGNKRKVRDLQRILVHSKAMLLTAIKRVTQVNRGKRIAGIDGMVIQTSAERWKLYKQMENQQIEVHNPKPSYRIYIKKKNGKLRPLSIPTIKDRIYQFMVKSALEPQWEARFETCSYGFRPERGCHDAVQRIVMSTQKGGKRWIFEGDFKGCFDNLNHEYIMDRIGDFPYRTLIEKWLKAGYVDNGVFNETESGTGQGNIVSPLLANIALTGMEEALGIRYRAQNKNGKYAGHTNETVYSLSFYADDFVIVCKTKEDAEKVYDKLNPYLKQRGLELSEEKTRIVEITEGFNFLGFNIRMMPTWYEEILLTRPSKETRKKSKEKIRDIFQKCNGRKTNELISQLNPVITGLAGYWSPFNSKQAFKEIDDYIWKKYFKADKTGQSKSKWILTAPDTENQLKRMARIPIVRHPLIRHCTTPYNAELKEYFEERHKREFRRNTIASRQRLAHIQKYCCPLCRQSITNFTEKLITQLKVPEAAGGKYTYRNMQLVHYRCGKYWEDWKRKYGEDQDADSRRRCEKEIHQLRLAGTI